MDNISYSPSEMIDLVLDGEIDHSQSSSLFTNLATDNTLQAEFHQALAIRRAMSNEIQTSVPSAQFTNTLFNRAGIGVTSEVATSVIVQNTTQWAQLATTALISFVIGAVAIVSIGSFSTNKPTQNVTVQPNPIELPKLYSISIEPEIEIKTQKAIKSSNTKKEVTDNYSKKILTPLHNSSNK